MKKIWVTYCIFLACFQTASFVLLYKLGMYDYSVADSFNILWFIGLIGLAFRIRIRIFFKKLWRFLFAVALIVYTHTWIVLPAILIFIKNIPTNKMIIIMLFNIPLLPLPYALYLYAWSSEQLWNPNL